MPLFFCLKDAPIYASSPQTICPRAPVASVPGERGPVRVRFRAQVERNPLRADEVDFFQCMRNVVVLGRPLYYAGEVEAARRAASAPRL